MVINRRGQAEEGLQEPVDGRGGVEITPAHDMRHALHRIIQHHREMIARRDILADEHDVTPDRGIGGNGQLRPLPRLAPVERTRQPGQSRAGIEPDGEGPLPCRMLATGAGIEDRAIGIARGIVARSLLDLAARAGAAENKPARREDLR